jgi:hypothetical protein
MRRAACTVGSVDDLACSVCASPVELDSGWEHVADVLGHNGTRMAALVYRQVLAPTVEARAGPMQELLGEPDEAIGSPGAHDTAPDGDGEG